MLAVLHQVMGRKGGANVAAERGSEFYASIGQKGDETTEWRPAREGAHREGKQGE